MLVQTLEFHLDHFEGPMDLLMHLIEKDSIDIYNIPIATLTDQYLFYIEEAENMNLEIASHFLLMAAQLIRIKIKLLLPKKRHQEDTEDPRQELINQLLAYKLFKELTESLEEVHEKASHYYTREIDSKKLSEAYKSFEALKGLNPLKLLDFFEVLQKSLDEKEAFIVVEKTTYSIENLRKKLIDYCQHAKKPTFQTILKQCDNRDEMITFFLALLECIHQHEMLTIQHELFGDIWLQTEAV